ncbi:paraquat-inducible protein A [Burkholderia pseudomultivorans]|uniref:paraquat-inducible protein A n=1 Tax=Burkholderia pseudomultivorans TaxID=1207504 RepID=UPI000756771A|nr:paraquat-inducible protein A [Burkholderia pseudomultivorans]KWE99467.1 paraquat-inducible protein A [Burkholderia pseudomultivorans]MBF5010607.1 paraquat-inducible protein A [Burkholderia pseudomultivorans]
MTKHEPKHHAAGHASACLSNLIACEYCSAVYLRAPLAEGACARCLRCGGLLYRESTLAYVRLLPLVLAALILFVISIAFPIVELDISGMRTQATLWGTVEALFLDDMPLISVVVFATTVLFPLAEMLMMLYLLLPMSLRCVPPGFAHVVRGIKQARLWGMIEVFMLGVLVTLVKISSTAHLLPGLALWSFGALVCVLTTLLVFDPRSLWLHADKAPQQ